MGCLSTRDVQGKETERSPGVKAEQLHADGWAIGYDERFPSTLRIQQALLFARWDRHENLYAHPMVRASRNDDLARRLISMSGFRPSGGLHHQEGYSPHRCSPHVHCLKLRNQHTIDTQEAKKV